MSKVDFKLNSSGVRALLQSSLENALTYYCSTLTDDYISIEKGMKFSTSESDGKRRGQGNTYASPTGPLLAYRGLFGNASAAYKVDFKEYFLTTGTFLYDDNIDVSFKYENKIIYEEMSATATQTVSFPIDFSVFGVGRELRLVASAKAVSVDNENIVDNIDFAIHLINKTKLGDALKNIGARVAKVYSDIQNILGWE